MNDEVMNAKLEYDFYSGLYYCSPDCPHLSGDPESVNKICLVNQKPLQFYDWHIAHCEAISTPLVK
jgi:hypothetical protein